MGQRNMACCFLAWVQSDCHRDQRGASHRIAAGFEILSEGPVDIRGGL